MFVIFHVINNQLLTLKGQHNIGLRPILSETRPIIILPINCPMLKQPPNAPTSTGVPQPGIAPHLIVDHRLGKLGILLFSPNLTPKKIRENWYCYC